MQVVVVACNSHSVHVLHVPANNGLIPAAAPWYTYVVIQADRRYDLKLHNNRTSVV